MDLASRREDNKAMLWIQEVEMLDTVTDEQLMDEQHRRFRMLDKALATACQKIAHGELGRTITDRVNKCIREHKRVCRGRELLRMIVRYYQSNKVVEKVSSLADLLIVKMGDPH